MLLMLGQIVGNGKPRCLGADEDVPAGPDGWAVDQRAHGDMDPGAVAHHRVEQRTARPAVRVVRLVAAVDQELVVALGDSQLFALDAGKRLERRPCRAPAVRAMAVHGVAEGVGHGVLHGAAEALASECLDAHSAARRVGAGSTRDVRMVTNSSPAVGWMPTVASNCALVAPAFTPTAKPWISSAASSPTMCTPTTRSVAASTISFMKVRCWRPDTVYFIGRNAAVKTLISPSVSLASSSVRPTVASSGWQNTAEGTSRWSGLRFLLPNSVSAKQWPSMMATGVRLMRSVTSPTAQMLDAVDFDHSSTATAPALSSCTPTFSRPMPDVFGARPVAY